MAIIDPVALAGSNGGNESTKVRRCGAGRKLVVPVGFHHRAINGTPVVDIHSVCIADLDEGDAADDEGAELVDTFWLNDKSMWRLAKFALRLGWQEPFDPDSPESLGEVLQSGPVIANIQIVERNGYENQRVDANGYEAHNLANDPTTNRPELTPHQRGLVEQAERRVAGLLRWKAEQSGSAPNRDTTGSNASSFNDDEIPF